VAAQYYEDSCGLDVASRSLHETTAQPSVVKGRRFTSIGTIAVEHLGQELAAFRRELCRLSKTTLLSVSP
jgi:hypothetical protein